MAKSLRVDDTLALLAARLKAVIPFQGVAIYTVEGDRLATRYTSGEDAALFSSLEIPLGEGISGWVTQHNKPIVNGNPSVEPGYLNDPARFSVHRSALSVPLLGIEGVIGALTLYQRQPAAFTKEHLRILLAVSSKAGLMIENVLRFAHAEETATTDALTGLHNARSLFLRLDGALKKAAGQSSRLALLVTDVDGFKQVNDQFGHSYGNRILERTGDALRAVCRPGDEAARMGGDEFVLLLPDCGPEGVELRVEQLNRLIVDAGRQVCGIDSLCMSVGAAYFPQDGIDAEELLAKADARMYEMKRRHHSRLDAGRSLTKLAQVVEVAANSSDMVSLSAELEKLVNAKVQSNQYHSASEVIREALQLLAAWDLPGARGADVAIGRRFASCNLDEAAELLPHSHNPQSRP